MEHYGKPWNIYGTFMEPSWNIVNNHENIIENMETALVKHGPCMLGAPPGTPSAACSHLVASRACLRACSPFPSKLSACTAMCLARIFHPGQRRSKQASTKKGSERTRVEGNTEGKAARKEEEQEEGMKANMTRDHWAGGVKQHKETQPNEENLPQCVI